MAFGTFLTRHLFAVLILFFSDLCHLCLHVRLLLADQDCEIVILLLFFPRESELFLVTRRIAEAQMLRNGTFTGTGYHGQRGAQLFIKVLLQRDDHFNL